jgi:NAD(P)-dependent dehydrogenase (short-subunit alcohol dehydrogenase family)
MTTQINPGQNRPIPPRLEGKVALVTGASDRRSIGWGIANALAQEGAHIVLNDYRDLPALEQRAHELTLFGVQAIPFLADVTQPDQVESMVQRAAQILGAVDIAASNAGIIRWENFLTLTPTNMRAILNVNLSGNVHVCQSAARQMIKQGTGGRIIITSSVQADMQFPETLVYSSTKRAMHCFVGTLALELAQYNITVNHIGPGWVRSALNDPAPDQQTAEAIEQQRQAVPLKRDGDIYEMGRAAVYFASPDAAYVTGAFLRLDGGLGISKYSY